jgi:LysM repeat protein
MKIRLFICLFLCTFTAFASDSLRTETLNGRRVMVFKVEKGQTLYAIARKYALNVNEIKALNPKINTLKVGDELYLPLKQNALTETQTEKTLAPVNKESESNENAITHEVKKGETLFKISKLYNVSIADIVNANQTGSSVKPGQILTIPQKTPKAGKEMTNQIPVASPETAKTIPEPKSEKKINATGYPSITEAGIAKLDETFDNNLLFKVMHKNAPIGTIMLLKNKLNNNSVHATVVGNTTSDDSVLLLVNRRIYDKLEATSSIFQVEIFYTPEQ